MVPVLFGRLHSMYQAVSYLCVLTLCVGIGPVECDGGNQDVLAWIKTPQPTAVVRGHDLILACEVQHVNKSYSSSPLIYSWTKDGGPVPAKASMFANHTLFIPQVGEEDIGQYMCTVTTDDWNGETSVIANVIDAYLDPFVIDPKSQLVKIGNLFVLTCVTGQSAPHLEVYWMKDGERFNAGNQITAAFGDYDAEGLRVQTSLRLEAVASSDTTGIYQCYARNRLLQSPVLSLSAEISLESIPTNLLPVIEWTVPKSLVIAEGRDLVLGCRSQVSTEPVQTGWYLGRYLVDESKRVYVLPNSSLAFLPLSAKDKGSYRCRVTNSKGSTWSPSVELVIAYINVLFREEPSDTFALYGQNVTFQCDPPESLPKASVVWYKNFAVFDLASRPGAEIIDHNLRLSSVMKSDIGDYYCVAVNEMTSPSSRTSRVAKLKVEGPPQMTKPPNSKRLLRGSLLHLICLVESDPLPTVTWKHQGRKLSEGQGVTIVNRGQELWISNVGKSWEGEYTCICTNNYGSISASTFVTVIVPPVSLRPLGTMTVTAGLSFTIPCPVDGYPIPSVEWFHNGTQISAREGDIHGQQMRWKMNSFSLVIDDVTPDYSGTYQCVATNEGGTVTSSGDLVIYVPPYFLETPKDITRVVGQKGVLSCRVGGNTSPSIHWLLNDTVPAVGQLSEDNTTLTLPSISWEHIGVYTCVAVNNVGKAKRSASIGLLVPPVIQSTNQPDNPIKVNTQFTLSCVASGIPTPIIKWTHQDIPLSSSLNGRIRFPLMGMLVIESALEEDSGIYKCIAESSAGSDTAALSVNIYGRPHPPSLLAAVPLTSTSVYLLWEWSTDEQGSSQMVESFRIFYRKKSNEVVDMYPDIFPFNVTRKEVMGLEPGTSYVFYVKAANDAGTSEASNILTALTFHSAPSAPANLKVSDVQPRSATVTWEPPAVPNGVIKLYQLRYKRENVSMAYEVINISRPVFPTQELTLHSLRPFFNYTVQARAATLHEDKELWGSYSSSIILQTKMDKPSLPPQSVHARAVDANSIQVTWEGVPELGRNGPVTSYIITCMDDNDIQIATRTVDGSANKRTVHGLSPWRQYWFVVKGVNPMGVGSGSKPVDMKTLPLAPMSVPRQFSVVPQSSTSVTLSWKPLPSEIVTCDVTAYYLRYRRKSQDVWITKHIPSNTNVYSVNELMPWSLYEFTIAAFTNTVTPGLGPYTQPLSVSTLQGESSPVTALSFTSYSMSVLLSWKPPLDVKGNLIYYSIQYHPIRTENTSKSLTIPANTTESLVSDLSPNTTYNVSLSAVNEGGIGQNTILLVKTLPFSPTSTDAVVTTVETDHYTANVSTATALYLQEDSEQSHLKKNLASIVAGSIIGAIAFIVLVIFICAQCKKYRKKQRLSYVIEGEEGMAEEGMGQQSEGQESGICNNTSNPQTSDTPSTTTTADEVDGVKRVSSLSTVEQSDNKNKEGEVTDGQSVSQQPPGNKAGKEASKSQSKRFSIRSSKDYSKLKEDSAGENVSNSGEPETVPSSLPTVSSFASIEGAVSKSVDDNVSIMSETLKRRSRMRSESAAAIAVMRNSQIISIDDSEMLIDNEIQAEVVFNERTVL